MQHFDLCVIGTGSGNSIVDERFADRQALVDQRVGQGGLRRHLRQRRLHPDQDAGPSRRSRAYA